MPRERRLGCYLLAIVTLLCHEQNGLWKVPMFFRTRSNRCLARKANTLTARVAQEPCEGLSMAGRVAAVALMVMFAFALSALAQSKESVLYSFQGGTDGQYPIGRTVFDATGNLYGVTQGGGSDTCTSYSLCGIVYELSPPARSGDPWTETILHTFQGHTGGDASDPLGGLVMDASGNLYGATGGGGTGDCEILGTFPGCGAVYEVSPPTEKGGAWTEQVLYSFQGGMDGAFPYGEIVFDNAGNLYGATQFGGGYGKYCGVTFYEYCGTVFELSPPKLKGGSWTEQVLYSFRGRTDAMQLGDGANPNGGFVIDKNGTLYGTTQIGGFNCPHNSNDGCGTVFRLSPPSKPGGEWRETIFHRFNPLIDGGEPLAGLVADTKGNLYGTTSANTVFQLSPPSGNLGLWSETLIHIFTSKEGGHSPEGSLLFDGTNLCGTTNGSDGGTSRGTVYFMSPTGTTPGAWAFDSLYTFSGPPDGENPVAGLTLGGEGVLYGTTQLGGTASNCSFTGCGTVFTISP